LSQHHAPRPRRASAGAPLLAIAGIALLALAVAATPALASSHREAPGITETPKVDGTDFYMFRSYEPGREDYVTLIANYTPLQDAYGGPNYFSLDPDAAYHIHIDNTGDGVEDLTYRFQTLQVNGDFQLPVGGVMVSVPLHAVGPNTLTTQEVYVINLLRGPMRTPTSAQAIRHANTNATVFAKPFDNIGNKTFPSYESYARAHIAPITIPGCAGPGRVFVGQRKEPFVVNLGEVFDLVNLNPVGPRDAEPSATEYKNITTFALEVPIECLVEDQGPTIGAWTTSVLPRNRKLLDNPSFNQTTVNEPLNDFVQVSRLGMPLVNEVVIGLKDKDRFNASSPKDDLANFATYVTNPTLPELLEILFGVGAPNNFPRADLVAAFVTGIGGLNEFGIGEMQRLNTDILPTPKAQQNNLGVLGGDNAGFPNGRRPGDDVVDAELRVAMGVLCHAFPGVFCDPADAPAGTLPYTDGALQDASQFDAVFPYLRSPVAGSPNGPNGIGIGN
jgi:hypothetical protein